MEDEALVGLLLFLFAVVVEGVSRGCVEAWVRDRWEQRRQERDGGVPLVDVVEANCDRLENLEERDEEREADVADLLARVEALEAKRARR
jgi:hypothetical protein